jgi:3-dehydroquinate synthase
MVEPILVSHASGSYPVRVEPGSLDNLEQLAQEHLPGRRHAIIADETVYQLYRGGKLSRKCWAAETLTIPSGERWKSRDSWTRLTDELLARGFGRDSGIIALGGGVTGDLAGFVAATFMRGIPYLQVPTTLLAMIDASIGGKTGVNTSHGKNLVGAFHPPAGVLADPLVLATLPEQEYRAGLAEAVKHGLIADRDYFEWMEAEAPALSRRDPEALVRLVHRSVEIKAEVVSADEREGGRRATLNAGHTIAHGLEQASEYALIHGEAVALGLLVECDLAERLGIASSGLRKRVAGLLARFHLPQQLPPGIDRMALLSAMRSDKKNRYGEIHFALPEDIGRMHRPNGWTIPVAEAALAEVIAAFSQSPKDPVSRD